MTRIVCMILISYRLSQTSCFTVSLKCFSSLPNNCCDVGIRPLLQFPQPLRTGPVVLTLLASPLLPSFYQVLCGSIYSFLVIRYSWLLSAGILQTLLFLKVYSWLSMERDVFHVHLHLHHLVFITSLFFVSVLFLFFYTFISIIF